MRKMHNIALAMVIAAGTVALAYVLGAGAGGYFAKKKAEKKFLQTRTAETEDLLANALHLAIGNTLPDGRFSTPTGESVSLYELLKDRTPVAFFSNTCPACIELAKRVSYAAEDVSDMECFVFITNKDPGELRSFCDDLGLRSPILIDEGLNYTQQLFNDMVIPTIIVVDSNAVIEDIFVGGLTEGEIENLMAYNKH